MTEQISQERIEAVAARVGFVSTVRIDPFYGLVGTWFGPDGLHYDDCPDFPNDIAACEKWIVKPLVGKGFMLTLHVDSGGACAHFQKKLIGSFSSDASFLSEAIFLAAEQLKEVSSD